MEKNFITKLKTEKYLIGSFDVFQENSKELIKLNSNITEEEADSIMKSMPTTYRASITDIDGNYIGFIGLYNINAQEQLASIRFETNVELTEEDKNIILDTYKNWVINSLNIIEIEEIIYQSKKLVKIDKQNIVPKSNFIMKNNLLIPGITESVLEHFASEYNIPKLQMPFTIMSSDKPIGIIGLSSLIWSNKRANLNIFIEKELGNDIINELSGYIIDDYLNYIHNANVHNVTLSVSGSDKNMVELLSKTNMNYYGTIPFSSINGDNIESNLMYQHIPNMEKQNDIYIPDNISEKITIFDTEKKELAEEIIIGEYRLVSPKLFEKNNINIGNILDSHINAMEDREGFAIPLGEDKYILQRGNGNYGISKMLQNYSYILLDSENNYSGYVNILRTNADNKNAEIEIGIDPKLQRKGLGTIVINKFYDELFSIGYASITSAVFDFNNPSMRLHEKVAELNGIRLESYYINGKLWNMNFYSRVNNIIESKSNEKHI